MAAYHCGESTKGMLRLRVKEIAEEKGFNQSSLARESGVGFTTVKRLFRDSYRETSLAVLEKIAKALGVSIHDLIEEIPEDLSE
jgi:putative transcriptional regulator